MKKIISLLTLVLLASLPSLAQKNAVAIIDANYILRQIPAYETAQEQLDKESQKWRSEIEKVNAEAKTLYDNYQTEIALLSPEMKVKRENEIIEKEKQAQELKRKYFGENGELFKKQSALLKPIQDEIYTAVKSIADKEGYAIVLDKNTTRSLIYAVPKIDISDQVLTALGYAK